MRIPFKTRLSIIVFAALMVLQYQNCSNYADQSPFDLPSEASLADGSSSPSALRLDSPTGVIDIGEYDLALSMGGTCNTGLSKSHYIEIKLADSNNLPIQVRVAPQDNSCPEGGANLQPHCFVAKQFSCEHGRYYIHLPISCAAYRQQPQSLYRIIGQLVAVDENGAETRDAKAGFNRFFQIAWAPGACP